MAIPTVARLLPTGVPLGENTCTTTLAGATRSQVLKALLGETLVTEYWAKTGKVISALPTGPAAVPAVPICRSAAVGGAAVVALPPHPAREPTRKIKVSARRRSVI